MLGMFFSRQGVEFNMLVHAMCLSWRWWTNLCLSIKLARTYPFTIPPILLYYWQVFLHLLMNIWLHFYL